MLERDLQDYLFDNPEVLFPAAATALSALGIAFVELREPDFEGSRGMAERPPIAPLIRKAFGGPLILNSDYDRAKAEAALASGVADAFAFGRSFLSNPDLPHRLEENIPLTPDDPDTWYTQGREGYSDYSSAA